MDVAFLYILHTQGDHTPRFDRDSPDLKVCVIVSRENASGVGTLKCPGLESGVPNGAGSFDFCRLFPLQI